MNELKLLKIFYKSKNKCLTEQQLENLLNNQLSKYDLNILMKSMIKDKYVAYRFLRDVKSDGCGDNDTQNAVRVYFLRNKGVNRFEELRSIKNSRRFNEVRAWITLTIAIIALLVSILSFVNQS